MLIVLEYIKENNKCNYSIINEEAISSTMVSLVNCKVKTYENEVQIVEADNEDNILYSFPRQLTLIEYL